MGDRPGRFHSAVAVVTAGGNPARRFRHITEDAELRWLDGRHAESARRTVDADPEAAYALAYDAARKSATALLAYQGLRPTTAGGHIVVVDVIRAQFPGVPGLTSLDRLRRRRNQAEYPDPKSYDPITGAEANEAIQVAAGCISSVERLLQLDELGVF